MGAEGKAGTAQFGLELPDAESAVAPPGHFYRDQGPVYQKYSGLRQRFRDS
jgi:hypothetical protein